VLSILLVVNDAVTVRLLLVFLLMPDSWLI